ncbi:hypothetical protein GCM10008995_24020 [Halobellus salinus]|uniref:Uncharacterized protein n=1 Tax=Halobellus salinus TaxID=931585 RepID=A0A830EHX3_9EURY|nr:hypothetical protein [Halobellus salinus]GGJ13365.1 hypothetical protein GCM10008995_24020 [Halobellus salinus]SMP15649.1 hypothetical protein SAMN06265347_105164 [Halobellus salinus]
MSEHTPNIDPGDAGSAALLAGFLIVVGVLYAQDPAAAIDAATSGVGATVYFVVLPALGLASGVYAYADGPYSGVSLFCLGSYLGVFGVGLAFGTLATASTSVPLLIGGVVLVALAVVAIVASLLRVFGAVEVGLPGLSPK